jgi:DNA-binding transcriptional LysR family regulator
MKVDLVAEDRLIDLVAQGFDASVRLGDSLPADIIAVPLVREQNFAVVGAPDYFVRRKDRAERSSVSMIERGS